MRDAIRATVRGWLHPVFTPERHGQPGYCQLHRNGPRKTATGAEMGAFRHLKQPQREANLRLRLGEDLPFGLEPGLI